MKPVLDQVDLAKKQFREKFQYMMDSGGLTKERYIRFLSMQYHLTNGVPRHFMIAASHPSTASRKELRKWLFKFAIEEEFHYEIAKADLNALGAEPLPCPFDVQLWWKYFDDAVETTPFVRLGNTAIFENIGDGASDLIEKMIVTSDFLNPKNLRFVIIHRHGPNLAHGDQILEALEKANLTSEELAHAALGAKNARLFYMRLTHWVIFGEEIY